MTETLRTRRLVAIVAALCLLGSALAAACPTCDTDAHAPAATGGDGAAGRLADDWPEGDAGCTCCEASGCADPAELPDGLRTRPAQVAPAVAAVLPASLCCPERSRRAATEHADPAPPCPTRLHIQHQSFRC